MLATAPRKVNLDFQKVVKPPVLVMQPFVAAPMKRWPAVVKYAKRGFASLVIAQTGWAVAWYYQRSELTAVSPLAMYVVSMLAMDAYSALP